MTGSSRLAPGIVTGLTAGITVLFLAIAAAALAGRAASPGAISLNGSTQYVRIGSPSTVADGLTAQQFTLEAWVRRTGTGLTTSTGTGGITAAPIVAKGRAEADGSNKDMNYFLGIDAAGRLAADFEEGAGQPSPGLNHPVTGTSVVSSGTWHHVAATYDGQTWRLYLDGALDRVLTLASPRSPRSDAVHRTAIGTALTSSGTAAGFFAGQLDEVRIWRVARTAGEIAASMKQEIESPATGLLARFGFGEGAGTTAANAVGGTAGTFRPSGAGPTWSIGYPFTVAGDTTPPSSPAGLTATVGAGGVALAWTASPEADLAGYRVYRVTGTAAGTGGGPLDGAALLTAPAKNDTSAAAGTTYTYVVTAVDTSGNESGLSAPRTVSVPPSSADPVLVTAGDIAGCSWTRDTSTAAVVTGVPNATVLTLGDNVYENGTLTEFTSCYAPAWGGFRARTRPTPGNHDYNTPGATGYFDYFNGVGVASGPAGSRALGYYSFDVGSWHVVVLNSECETTTGLWSKGGCAAGSTQEAWFRADLAAAATNNVIVAWHKPRFSSSGSNAHMQALWKAAYDGGVDIVLSGHTHNYERFAPLDANGATNTASGIREFVVGTGGASAHAFGTVAAGSAVRATGVQGVLQLTLHASSYDWRFLPIAGQTFADAGTADVHGRP